MVEPVWLSWFDWFDWFGWLVIVGPIRLVVGLVWLDWSAQLVWLAASVIMACLN